MAATATAVWNGSLDEGSGTMSTATGLEGPYTKASRFADGDGTNPEELLGAAHAGCFSMFLSALLSADGNVPTSIETTAKVSIDASQSPPRITRIALTTVGAVDGISAEQFQEKAEAAKADCPVSAALASVDDITLEASLRG